MRILGQGLIIAAIVAAPLHAGIPQSKAMPMPIGSETMQAAGAADMNSRNGKWFMGDRPATPEEIARMHPATPEAPASPPRPPAPPSPAPAPPQ